MTMAHTNDTDSLDKAIAKHRILPDEPTDLKRGQTGIPISNDRQRNRLSERARKELDEILFARSTIFSDPILKQHWARLPRFDRQELVLGKVLGTGEFCVVREIDRVVLTSRAFGEAPELSSDREALVSLREKENGDEANSDGSASNRCPAAGSECLDEERRRVFISSHCTRKDGNARYAIKTIRYDKLAKQEDFVEATMDLAIEAHFLAGVDHPNIIKLRGLAIEEPCNQQFFVIFDRLYGTLAEQLLEWQSRKKKLSTFVSRVFRDVKGKERKILWDERLTVASDLAAALKYIHFRGIMHRDLKPDNIGFDLKGSVKIFDFGLAKEIPPSDERLVDGTYDLSGQTGSLRYMAPEVFINEPYNEAVDVYSLSIVLWEIFSLEKAFDGFDERAMASTVFGRGFRPPMDETWPDSLKNVIRCCWSVLFRDRPSAAAATDVLRRELIRSRGGEESGKSAADSSRRSLYRSTPSSSVLR